MQQEEERKGLGIFGGTFNPIHYGHLRLAEHVCAAMNLERIVFIPDSLPPHKQGMEYAPAKQRYEMVQRAIASYPNFTVSDIELCREGLSYTVDTLRELGDLFPNTPLYFIVGADSIATLHTWHRAHDMLQLATFLGVGRPGYDNVLDVAVEHFGEQAREHIILLNTPKYNISATDIRCRIRKGEDVSALVPPEVLSYIQENHLYK